MPEERRAETVIENGGMMLGSSVSRGVAVLLVAAIGMLAAAGCGSESTTTTSNSAVTTGSTTAVTESATSTTGGASGGSTDVASLAQKDAAAQGAKVDPPTKKKIGFLLLSSETESDMTIFSSVKDAAAAFGFEVVMTDWNFDVSKLPGAASALLAQNPDLFIIDAADPTKISDVLAECQKRNIPVMMISAQQNPSEYITGNFVPERRK